ncbi:MAG TPA: Hsp20/alpha crystallin family protein [Candidatus Limnocylindrales bacterium]|nr:Hsp20/alpha crystallin family protein [Candidatus Limnocylindrales bacterium]
MSYDLVPSRLLSFPSIQLPSIWNDEDDWLTTPSNPSGLSVSEDEKNIYIEAAIPGIDPKNIEITFHDGYLWIKGEQKEEEKDSKKKYYREAAKSFSYRVAVPGDIDNNLEPVATYKHGVMKVAFVKLAKTQPKKIQIKSVSE